MNGAEPQGIGERVLVERTVEAGRCRQADELKSLVQLQDQMRHSINGAAPADVHEVLNRHRLVARSRPQDGRTEPWLIVEQ